MSGSRRRLPLRWPLAAVLVAVALTVAAGTPPGAEARPLVTGITNVGGNEPLAFQQTHESGARFVRIPLNWHEIAPEVRPAGWLADDPSSPGYSWAHSDETVVRAVQAGLTPVLQVDGAPRWAQRCETPASLESAICDPDPAELAAFGTAAARRYSGAVPGLPRVRYWQALNEPNLSLFFFPQFDTAGKALSPGLYRNLVNAFYASVKAVNSSNLVLAAGLGPIGKPPYTIGPMRFARELLCMKGRRKPHPARGNCGGGVRFDIFAIHPYTTGGPTHRGKADDVQLGDLGKLQTLLKAADKAGRIKGKFRRTPLWITELSWDSKPPDPGGLPMKILCRWAAEALHHSWRAGVDHFFWFSLQDDVAEPNRPFSETLQSGLFFRGATVAENRPKKVFYAFRFPFVAYPKKKGLSFWGRTPTSKPGRVTIQLRDGARWRKALVARAGKGGVFSGLVHTAYGSDRHGLARAVFKGKAGVPFSMRPVKDFRHAPFG